MLCAKNILGTAMHRDGSQRSIAIAIVGTALFLSSLQTTAVAETYLTFNILDRVKRIIVGAVSATTFTIEVDGRQYLITAKHVVATLKDEDEVSICSSAAKCVPLHVKVLRCSEPIDIAVLVPPHVLTTSYDLDPTLDGARFGQEMYFLGFPFGDTSLSTNFGDDTVRRHLAKRLLKGLNPCHPRRSAPHRRQHRQAAGAAATGFITTIRELFAFISHCRAIG
jgi:hypothetical protein